MAGPKGNKTFGPTRQIATKPNRNGSFAKPYAQGRQKPPPKTNERSLAGIDQKP